MNARDGPYQNANDCTGTTTFEYWMQGSEGSLQFNNFHADCQRESSELVSVDERLIYDKRFGRR